MNISKKEYLLRMRNTLGKKIYILFITLYIIAAKTEVLFDEQFEMMYKSISQDLFLRKSMWRTIRYIRRIVKGVNWQKLLDEIDVNDRCYLASMDLAKKLKLDKPIHEQLSVQNFLDSFPDKEK